jgi:hypothetical protein
MAKYKLRFFFDAGAGTCLWAGNEAASHDYDYAIMPDQLPLTPTVRQEVENLVSWYDTGLDWNNPGGSSPWNEAELHKFILAAQETLQTLKEELGEDYELMDES